MELDAVLLSRIQFALTIMFHYLFPPLTIGLGVFMVLIEGMWIKTGDPMYKSMALFWTRIFAVNFAMGVSTGIVMEFEFGTNWATYSRFVGDVFGSALAAEGIFAFFLESGFLAVLLFGWDKVSPRMHFFSTCMVALGAIFSSIWIVVANSWMQTPAGYHLAPAPEGGMRAEITDFWMMVFNPSSVDRLLHVWFGCFILGAFFVMSVSAYYILKGRHLDFAKRTFKLALVYGTVVSCSMLTSGDMQAKEVARNQPAKLAALEGHFKTGHGGAPLSLFGIPNTEEKRVDFEIAIPGLLSYLVHGDFNAPVMGLDMFPRKDWPPVAIPFFSYHLMVGLGMSFIGLTLLACFLWWRGTLFETRWLLWLFVFWVGGAFAANQAGWVAAEVGRQPWIVWHLLRTEDAISKHVPAEHVLASIVMFGSIYALLFVIWLTVLNAKIQHGPEEPLPAPEQITPEGFLEAAAHRADPSGPSMTMAREDSPDRPETRK